MRSPRVAVCCHGRQKIGYIYYLSRGRGRQLANLQRHLTNESQDFQSSLQLQVLVQMIVNTL
jgi:hypothetical protein